MNKQLEMKKEYQKYLHQLKYKLDMPFSEMNILIK